jgi:methylisocitrate lyase
MDASASRVAEFRRLHESGCFVMPNPWDPGSARALAGMGFPALATTSAGFAWSTGRADNSVGLEETLEHLRLIVDAVNVPVNADFQGGYATEPDGVATNVGRAVKTGIARGCPSRTSPETRPSRFWSSALPSSASGPLGRLSKTVGRASC